MLPIGPFRPNTVTVQRMQTSGTSGAGDPLPTAPVTIYAALPCLVDMMPRGGDIVDAKIGPVVSQVYTLYADGVAAYGASAGSTIDVTIGGTTFPFIVAPNGRSAFPDIRKNDRITDETGRAFLVIAVAQYYDVAPGLQAHLRIGEAWG